MTLRQDKIEQVIKGHAATFLENESNKTALLTVTNCTISSDMKKATIYFTVLPESKEKAALDFAKRKRTEMRTYIKKHMETKIIPFIEIEIDQGEKHRQKIDELLRQG